jgi:hypothetical protein
MKGQVCYYFAVAVENPDVGPQRSVLFGDRDWSTIAFYYFLIVRLM